MPLVELHLRWCYKPCSHVLNVLVISYLCYGTKWQPRHYTCFGVASGPDEVDPPPFLFNLAGLLLSVVWWVMETEVVVNWSILYTDNWKVLILLVQILGGRMVCVGVCSDSGKTERQYQHMHPQWNPMASSVSIQNTLVLNPTDVMISHWLEVFFR